MFPHTKQKGQHDSENSAILKNQLDRTDSNSAGPTVMFCVSFQGLHQRNLQVVFAWAQAEATHLLGSAFSVVAKEMNGNVLCVSL